MEYILHNVEKRLDRYLQCSSPSEDGNIASGGDCFIGIERISEGFNTVFDSGRMDRKSLGLCAAAINFLVDGY